MFVVIILVQVIDGARVVYGDGTSAALIRAAGVQEPTAIAITYAEPERCLRATELLRDAFPDTPIFVRSDEQNELKKLIQAGATEVIVASGSVASGIGQLLGVRRDSRLGDDINNTGTAIAFNNMAASLYPPVEKAADQKLSGLAEEMDSASDREEIRKLFRLFSTSLTLNEDGQAQVSELMDELLRTSDLSVTDDQVTDLLGSEYLNDQAMLDAMKKYVSFSEFIMLYRKNILLSKKQESTNQ